MRCLLLALVVACSPSPRSAAPPPAAPPPQDAPRPDAAPPDAAPPVDAASADAFLADAAPARKYAKRGEVCRRSPAHAANREQLKPIPCEPGLQCCYPCGIQGCDNVCMTPAQCNVTRP